MIRVERAQQILAALRCVAVPQRAQFGDRLVMPIDAQIDQREALAFHDQQMRAAHRRRSRRPRRALPPVRAAAVPPVAPSDRPGMRAAWRQARARWRGCCRSRRHPAPAASLISGSRACPAIGRGVARASSTAICRQCAYGVDATSASTRLLRRAAGTQQGDAAWPEARIGAMLRQHGADTSRTECDARADCDRGCGDGSTDLACARAAADE